MLPTGRKNKADTDAKSNRVDLLAEDENGDLLLIEVQGEPEFAYFQRMLFGASTLVTEYIDSGVSTRPLGRFALQRTTST